MAYSLVRLSFNQKSQVQFPAWQVQENLVDAGILVCEFGCWLGPATLPSASRKEVVTFSVIALLPLKTGPRVLNPVS